MEQSRLQEALPAFDRGIIDPEALVGGDHPLVLGARGARARTRFALGHWNAGMEELQNAIARLEAIGKPGDEQRAELLAILGAVRRQEGKVAEALELHRQLERELRNT